MMRGWHGCFLLTAIVFVLQMLPFTGFILMILAGQFWSIVLVNLGFALMARDALNGAQPRYLLLAPILWFGGYAIATTVSHWRAARLDAEIAAANAGKRIVFDPARHDVLIEPVATYESGGLPLQAEYIVRSFAVDRIYWLEDPKRDIVRAIWVRQSACPAERGVASTGDRRWFTPSDGGSATDTPLVRARQLCLFDAEVRPARPTIRIRPQPQIGGYDSGYSSREILVDTPDGRSTTLRSAAVRPLHWLPAPVIGCQWHIGAPREPCAVAFLRERAYAGRNPQSPSDVVAHALGLQKATLRQRYPDADWR